MKSTKVLFALWILRFEVIITSDNAFIIHGHFMKD